MQINITNVIGNKTTNVIGNKTTTDKNLIGIRSIFKKEKAR